MGKQFDIKNFTKKMWNQVLMPLALLESKIDAWIMYKK
jgi:uncharacterized protein (DUF885 family)